MYNTWAGSVVDPNPYPDCIRIQWGTWIQIYVGKNYPQRKKLKNFIFWMLECSLLRAEGFSCCLNVLYGGLGISKLKVLIKKRNLKKFSCIFSPSGFGHHRSRSTDLCMAKGLLCLAGWRWWTSWPGRCCTWSTPTRRRLFAAKTSSTASGPSSGRSRSSGGRSSSELTVYRYTKQFFTPSVETRFQLHLSGFGSM